MGALIAKLLSLLGAASSSMRRPALRGMQHPDFECFNNEVVRRPEWQELRELAAEALRAFGWERVVVWRFAEGQPGVWHRPHAETEPDAAAADGGM